MKKRDPQKELQRIQSVFKRSNTNFSSSIKMRMAELVIDIANRRKKFGLFIILGWKKKWQLYADTPDASQDIFAQRHANIMRIPPKGKRHDGIVKTINFDGAILIDARGNVLHSGVMIEGLRPRATLRRLNRHRTPDLSSGFGFKHKVHMRHIAAITSSYLFKGTTVFTVSEETDDIHILEGGKIIYSTVRGE